MAHNKPFKIRVLGSIAGLIVGAVLGALVAMASSSGIFSAVVGGGIGLVAGFCFPTAAGRVFGGFIDMP